jgi:hypothetical protein
MHPSNKAPKLYPTTLELLIVFVFTLPYLHQIRRIQFISQLILAAWTRR